LFASPDLACWCCGWDRFASAAWFADSRFDLAFAERSFERVGVIAAVSPELVRLDATGSERVHERQQVSLLVLVAGRQPHFQRRTMRVDG
jgi:hypothetical protein